jgi:SepF-like predicted cell division protein (DUF552 family)
MSSIDKDKKSSNSKLKPVAAAYRSATIESRVPPVGPTEAPSYLKSINPNVKYNVENQSLSKSTYGREFLHKKNEEVLLPPPKITIQVKENEKTEDEDESKCVFPVWTEKLDRFGNFQSKKSMAPKDMLVELERVLTELKSNNKFVYQDSSPDTLTFVLQKNCFYCKVEFDNFRTCELAIEVYIYQDNMCLLDIQELSGEHLTFSHFLHDFKTLLSERDIVQLPSCCSQKLMDSYGLDMDIGLDFFECE